MNCLSSLVNTIEGNIFKNLTKKSRNLIDDQFFLSISARYRTSNLHSLIQC